MNFKCTMVVQVASHQVQKNEMIEQKRELL